MRPRLVPRVVARPIWLCPGASGRAQVSSRDLAGDKMPPPVVNGPSTDATPPAWRWTGPYIGLNGGFGSGSW